MLSNSLSGIVAFGLLLAPALGTPTGNGNGCHEDNVLRALIRFSASASPFCSAYISIAPTSTVYVTTPIPTPTITIDPSVLPSYISQYDSTRVSSACSCLSIPPAIATLPAIPDASCDNEGLAYAIQPHSFRNTDVIFSSADIDYFKTAASTQTGFTTRIGFRNANPNLPFSVYGGSPISTDFIAVNHRGYLVPPATGVYTISSTYSDDIMLAWIGPNALNGAYTRENAAIEHAFSRPAVSTTVTLTAGQYYPFRVLAINAQGAVGFEMSVVGPSGEVIVSTVNLEPTPWFVQFSCDGSNPPFEPFGGEGVVVVPP